MNNNEALFEAVNRNDLSEVILLLESGADKEARDDHDNYGYKPLHYAAKLGHQNIVKYLVEKGADINACTLLQEATALHYAGDGGHKNVIEYLIEQGVDILAQDNAGLKPIDYLLVKDIIRENGFRF